MRFPERGSFSRQFFPSSRAGLLAGLTLAAALLAAPAAIRAQDAAPVPAASDAAAAQTAPASGDATLSATPGKKKKPAKTAKADRIVPTKDTVRAKKHDDKYNPLVGKDATLPDKQLYDKALLQLKSGHFDVARLDLQALLSTYPDSQYQMRSKLAIADAWYREGGTAALTQAEQEYKDFITFFPNVPESAEAQMRVGDIYFKQMDVPDRDYSKAMHAEEEYRTMLKQYPDAPPRITAEAKQKLREVQEVMATREAELGAFYATHMNWPATIARYQTVVDTYPQYSHMDDTLIGLGDAYEAEANAVRAQKLPEGAKARLLQEYDGKAAAAYRRVVLEHAAAPHVEDAKDRLVGMNLPVPVPTPDQVAASEALEGSRAQYTMSKRLQILFLHKPDTVTAANAGEPPLEDAAPTVAPTVVRSILADYRNAFNPAAATAAGTIAGPTNAPANAVANESDLAQAPSADQGAAVAPPSLSDVPGPGQGGGEGSTTMTESAPARPSTGVGGSGASLGVDVLTPGADTSADRVSTPPSSLPAATGQQDPNNGLHAVAPKNTAELPPVEQPAPAQDQINDLAGKAQPAAQTKDPNSKKKPKPAYDKEDESSSKHKKKKGLDKLNPF